MASTTSENRKRNEKKSTEQEEAHFVSRVTVILIREKERDYLLNLHMSQSTCFGTWIDNRAKRSNVEVTSIVGGRLLSCVRRVLSYTWHRERHVELLVMYDQTFGTRTLLAHAQRRRKERKKKKNQSSKKEGRKNVCVCVSVCVCVCLCLCVCVCTRACVHMLARGCLCAGTHALEKHFCSLIRKRCFHHSQVKSHSSYRWYRPIRLSLLYASLGDSEKQCHGKAFLAKRKYKTETQKHRWNAEWPLHIPATSPRCILHNGTLTNMVACFRGSFPNKGINLCWNSKSYEKALINQNRDDFANCIRTI